jgi:hypothetical protein
MNIYIEKNGSLTLIGSLPDSQAYDLADDDFLPDGRTIAIRSLPCDENPTGITQTDVYPVEDGVVLSNPAFVTGREGFIPVGD